MFLLRKIRKSNWLEQTFDWLGPSDIPADPIGDFDTKSNRLSLWRIDEGRTNLPRVIAAIASTRAHLSNVDIVLAQDAFIKSNFEIEENPGNSHDKDANRQWHIDVIKLSDVSLVRLVKEFCKSWDIRRFHEDDVAEYLEDAIEGGYLNLNELELTLRGDLEKTKEKRRRRQT